MDKKPIKFNFSQDVSDFIKSHGTAVWIGGLDEFYYNIPEWFKSTEDSNVFEVMSPDEMPIGLKKDLRIDVELSELQEKYNRLEKTFRECLAINEPVLDSSTYFWLNEAGLKEQ